MDAKPEFSIVIPAYNEAARIGSTLESLSDYFTTRGIPYETIVVNDGSIDLTQSIVENYAEANASIRVISYHPNRGKGYAIRRGVLSARADNVVLSDSDLATPIDDLEVLEKAAAEGCEVVVGSRAMKDSVIVGWRPWYRELSGKIFNRIVRLLAVPGIRDTQCGFKYFTNRSAQHIFSVARMSGYGFDVESLFLARKLGYRIAEVAVRWENSPATKVSVLRDTLPMLREVAQVRINDWKGLYESSECGK